MQPPWPTGVEAIEMPVDELAIRVVARLAATDWGLLNQTPLRTGQITTWVVQWEDSRSGRTQAEILQLRSSWVQALAEAWESARSDGLLAQAVSLNGNLDAYVVTRRGVELLAEDHPLAVLRAQRRLGVQLHDRLALRLRSLVRAGAFEQAAFDALREVEVRIRELAEDPRDQRGNRMSGLALVNHAFGDGGSLADPEADSGERRGLRDLFGGAFGAVRNPLGHRSVEWTDPTESAEMVLLADLLMRQLDRVEHRLQQGSAES